MVFENLTLICKDDLGAESFEESDSGNLFQFSDMLTDGRLSDTQSGSRFGKTSLRCNSNENFQSEILQHKPIFFTKVNFFKLYL